VLCGCGPRLSRQLAVIVDTPVKPDQCHQLTQCLPVARIIATCLGIIAGSAVSATPDWRTGDLRPSARRRRGASALVLLYCLFPVPQTAVRDYVGVRGPLRSPLLLDLLPCAARNCTAKKCGTGVSHFQSLGGDGRAFVVAQPMPWIRSASLASLIAHRDPVVGAGWPRRATARAQRPARREQFQGRVPPQGRRARSRCQRDAQRVDEISCQVPRYLQQGRTVLLLDPFAFRERSKMST